MNEVTKKNNPYRANSSKKINQANKLTDDFSDLNDS